MAQDLQINYLNQLNTDSFIHMLDDATECYKFYWLDAVLGLFSCGKTEISFDELINQMIVDAWYSVVEYHLHLGPKNAMGEVTNSLERAVLLLEKSSGLSSTASREEIMNAIQEQEKLLKKAKTQLSRNVPYRLLSSFMPNITGNDKIWDTGKLEIKNLAFGYGNYVIPYYPTTAFSIAGGRSLSAVPGIEYETEYYPLLYRELKNGLIANHYNLAGNEYWTESQEKRNKMTEFVKKYFAEVPEDAASITEDYKAYLAAQGNLLEQYRQGSASLYQIIEETRNYIMNDTKYTLSPGKTPRSQEAVTYFLKENKKGYSAHYATAAAILLRGIGIPTRYAEGVYISKEELADVTNDQTEISVSDKDLHAWVEVYQEDYGFVPVEFTPGRGDEDAESSAVSDEDSQQSKDQKSDKKDKNSGGEEGKLSVATPTPEPEEDMTFENIQTDNYNHEDQAQEETSPSESADKKDSNSSEPTKTMPIFVKILLTLVIVIVALILAAEIQRRVRIMIFKKQLRHDKTSRQILLLYHQLEKAFVQKHIRYTGQTVAEYSREIAEAYELEEEMVHAFIADVFCAKFSRDRFDKTEVYEYRQEYRVIRHRIYGQLKWPMKLYYMYVLCV